MINKELKEYIMKRINDIPSDIYNNSLYTLRMCGISSYDSEGNFILIEDIATNFNRIYKLLEENDIPDGNGIRQCLISFLVAIQNITGTRKFVEFIANCNKS